MSDAIVVTQDTVTTPAVFTPQVVAAPVTQNVTDTPPVVSAVDGAAAAAPVVPVVPTVDPIRSEIDSLADTLGFSREQFAGFKDVASAQAAARLAIESTVSKEWNPAAQSQATRFSSRSETAEPAAPTFEMTVPEHKPINIADYGLDAEEPAAKALLAYDARIAELTKTTMAMASYHKQLQEQQQMQQAQAVQQAADQTIDGYASVLYGTSKHRSTTQSIAKENLVNTAIRLAEMDRDAGRPYTLESSLAKARMIIENQIPGGSPQANQAQAAAPPAPPLAQFSPGPTGITQMKMTERWSENPAIRERFGF